MTRRVRVYRVGDEVVIYTPADRYQNEDFDKCKHPARFDSVPFDSVEIKTFDEIAALTEGKNEAGSAQFYYSGGELKHDSDRSECLMAKSEIKTKHFARINSKLDAELTKPTPNAVEVVRLQREKEKLKDKTEKQVYEIALANLIEDGHNKPKIKAKLEAKIAELAK